MGPLTPPFAALSLDTSANNARATPDLASSPPLSPGSDGPLSPFSEMSRRSIKLAAREPLPEDTLQDLVAEAAASGGDILDVVEAAQACGVIQGALERLALLAVINTDVSVQVKSLSFMSTCCAESGKLASQERRREERTKDVHEGRKANVRTAYIKLVGTEINSESKKAEAMSRTQGSEITRAMEEQKELEQRFEALVAARAVLRTMPNKNKLKENEDELHAVQEALRESTKRLKRNLQDSPNVQDNMARVHAERAKLQALLAKTAHEIEASGTFTSLIDYLAEEERAERESRELVAKEKAKSSAVKAMRAQVKADKKHHEEDVAKRTEALAELKASLKEIKTTTGAESRYLVKEASASADCTARVRSERLGQLEDDVAKLKAFIEIEKKAHEETAAFLRARTGQMREEALRWAGKHEQDTQKLDRETEVLKEIKQQDLSTMLELEDRYNRDTAAQKLESEGHARANREMTLEELGELEKRTRSVIKIQAVYRGYRVRRQAGAGKKKGKKGKGDKKKGGKKSPKKKK
ncbi:hypothetical protein KFL_000900170 [Klebsormidium nitens]|uniref:Dynein regulatory complex protein 9 n=1 Tax=Klebsormidium nitens TaxID=105231 RepID=A0A0U9HJ03_KLENI|nr:hypothetical protein KFL_000900170 [Klebsormidium nitens]|eukprot:GAQ81762.1 hypothetical protein KFL_000900170 [Klebsormidium nitens]